MPTHTHTHGAEPLASETNYGLSCFVSQLIENSAQSNMFARVLILNGSKINKWDFRECVESPSHLTFEVQLRTKPAPSLAFIPSARINKQEALAIDKIRMSDTRREFIAFAEHVGSGNGWRHNGTIRQSSIVLAVPLHFILNSPWFFPFAFFHNFFRLFRNERLDYCCRMIFMYFSFHYNILTCDHAIMAVLCVNNKHKILQLTILKSTLFLCGCAVSFLWAFRNFIFAFFISPEIMWMYCCRNEMI